MHAKTPATATATALVLGLLGPFPAAAQDMPSCKVDAELPCTTDTGAVVETREELDTWIESFPAAAEAAAGEAGPVEATNDPEAAADLPRCAEGSPVPCVTKTGAVVETEVELGSYIEAFPDEAGAAGDAEDPEAAPESASDEPAPDAAEPELPAAAAEPPPPAPEMPADEADGADASAAPAEGAVPAPSEDAAGNAEPVPSGEAVGGAEATAPQAEAAGQDGQAPAEAQAEPADAPEAADAPAEAAADETPGGNEDAAEGTVEDDIPEVASETPPEDPAAGAAPGMAQTDGATPPEAAAADAPEGEAAEVEETVVTEETARSSSEDFSTRISRQETASDEDDSDDREETIKRVIAAGLAGAALGALLDQGAEVVANSGDRVVLQQDDGNLRLFRDENALLRQPGARVRTETFDDGSTRTFVRRDDGSEVVTIRAADGTIMRRTRILPDGREVRLIDDTAQAQPVEVSRLPEPRREVVRYTGDEEALRRALAQATAQDVGRSFSLRQIREIDRVRYLAPEIEIDAITFATGSAAIQPDQARQLSALGRALARLVDENPGEVFLVEGHTDAVGDASYNLALSDRRAESVALALTEYFDVPPENLVVQGYGEFDLKVPAQGAERENRRANVRRITGLLGIESASLR